MNQETGGDYLVRFDLTHIGRFHYLPGAASAGGASLAVPGVTLVGAAGLGGASGLALVPLAGPLPLPMGTTQSNFFLWCAATSSLVVVCGFNSTASSQRVSLPGAAPVSTKPSLIWRNA